MTPGSPALSDFRVRAFFPADHAVVADGKIFVNGGAWTQLNFPTYPQVVPGVTLVAVLEVPFHEYQRDHKLSLGMVDADENPVQLHVDGEFRVGADVSLQYGEPTLMPIAITIHNLTVERPGYYAFTLAIDGNEYDRYRIRAMQVAVPMRLELRGPDGGEPRGD
jgi:hypothetical protein